VFQPSRTAFSLFYLVLRLEPRLLRELRDAGFLAAVLVVLLRLLVAERAEVDVVAASPAAARRDLAGAKANPSAAAVTGANNK
jgi:hypothetical protein